MNASSNIIFFASQVARLPLFLLQVVGAFVGLLVYFSSATYRRQLKTNLRQALPQAGVREQIFNAMQIGCQSLETIKIWFAPLATAQSFVSCVEGWEHVEAAQQKGCGILLISPHLGNWEAFGPYLLGKIELAALYRLHKSAALEALIRSGRGRFAQLAPASLGGVKNVMTRLKNGQAVFLLPDQVPSYGDGIWLPFFGQPAFTMTLAARLSAIKNVTTLMVYAERLAWGKGFKLKFIVPNPPITGRMEERALAINQNSERVIHEVPLQYLWGYNRYKHPGGAPLPPEFDGGA